MKIPRAHELVRFLAMTIGALASLFFVFFLVGEGVGDLLDGKAGAIPIIIMILLTVSGYVLSWFRVRKGAALMIAGALLMGIYLLIIGAKGNVLMALSFSLPFLLPGVMLLLLKRLALAPASEK